MFNIYLTVDDVYFLAICPLQGPKPKSIADFWTMVWQEEVCNIVCLTNLTEGTKVNLLYLHLQIFPLYNTVCAIRCYFCIRSVWIKRSM